MITKQYNQEENKNHPFPCASMELSLSKLENNIQKIKKLNRNQKLLFPIKANAYGAGMIPVAKFLEAKKLCDYFGVASTDEAFLLRTNGIKTKILILGQVSNNSAELEYIIENNIELTVSNLETIELLEKIGQRKNQKFNVHLLVDTGMGRCGFLFKDLQEIIDIILFSKNIKLVGVMTHFPVSDSLDKSEINFTKNQISKIKNLKNYLAQLTDIDKIIFHAANSGGLALSLNSGFDMIRPGIAAYGYPPKNLKIKLQPIFKLTSRVTLIKKYPAGHNIGYGLSYQTKKDNELVAIIPVGYGDGLSRTLSNKLEIKIGKNFYKSVGRISMDQFAIRVDKNVKLGAEAIIISDNPKDKNFCDKVAQLAGTINYETLCSLGNSNRIIHHFFY